MNTDQLKNTRDYVTEHDIRANTVLVGASKFGDAHRLFSVVLYNGDKTIRVDYNMCPVAHLTKKEVDTRVRKYFGLHFPDEYRGLKYGAIGDDGRISRAQDLYDKKAVEIINSTYKADPAEVLDCIMRDASDADVPFEEWCDTTGYDPDSRKAERIYQACRETRRDLIEWLGYSEFHKLDTEYERL